jgi:hypothetical protein
MDESFDLKEKLAIEYGISLPEGFRVVTLGNIASTKTGLRLSNHKSNSSEFPELEKFYLLTAKSIASNGSIDLEHEINVHSKDSTKETLEHGLDDFLVQPKDILLSRILTKSRASVAFVPDNLPAQVAFSDSIIRIRVDTSHANPIDVFEFLLSDSGWELLQQFASSLAGMTRVSPSGLSQTPIFLPCNQTSGNVGSLSTIANVIQQIQNQTLPDLQRLQSSSNKLNTDSLKPSKVELQKVGKHLQDLALKLMEPSLTDKVIEKYPTPIAVAYRRFYDSRFNVYEQMQRLVDLYEYTTFFVFNIVLADLFRRLDPNRFYLEEKRIRDAYKKYPVADRINFIKQIVETARANRGADLFIPELVDSSFTVQADKLRDLRNNLAHTATASESMQRKILEDHKPIIDELLRELEFLTDCRLVQIRCFYCEGGQLIYRMIVYQGAVPFPEDKPIGDDSQLEKLQLAEHDHLVMLNNEQQILDLHPLYQLVSNETTQYENHVCFLKQCKEGKLQVESIRTSVVLSTEGLDELEKLAKAKLLAQPPNT